MKVVNSPEIAKLNGYMEAMSCCLNGCNYVIWFNARGIEFNDEDLTSQTLDRLEIGKNFQEKTPDLELQELIKLAYPKSKPHLATMVEYNNCLLITRINTFIARINPSDNFKNVSKHKKRNLINRFWQNVGSVIDYENSRIFQYNPAFDVDDELWDFIIWGFTFVIINQMQNKCLLIHGGASD